MCFRNSPTASISNSHFIVQPLIFFQQKVRADSIWVNILCNLPRDLQEIFLYPWKGTQEKEWLFPSYGCSTQWQPPRGMRLSVQDKLCFETQDELSSDRWCGIAWMNPPCPICFGIQGSKFFSWFSSLSTEFVTCNWKNFHQYHGQFLIEN